ncbi:MAG: TIGR03619 family F420-dependent LLM class oxidoreductase [Gammaproteobacteria bacterium]
MEYGFSIPTRGPLARRDIIDAICERGEALGYQYFAIPDHIIIPGRIDSRYPYNESGDYPGSDTGECMEQLTLMAYLAATTTTAKLLSSVMVVPHRGAVHTAKTIATIDQLSGGRAVIGVGAGWMREEFEALGAPDFDRRGRVTDEYLEAFKVLWTEDDPRYEGEFVRFRDVTFSPKPQQRPYPPIWVGGESGPALRRTARLGDVWFPIGSNPRHPLNTPQRFADGVAGLRGACEKQGRNPDEVGLALWSNFYTEDKLVELDTGERHMFTGADEQIAEDVVSMREQGVDALLFNFQRASLESTLASMERFAETVLPQAGESLR